MARSPLWPHYDGMDDFSPATRFWFERSFPGPTEPQTRGWPVIAAGRHCLITAPTGSGKTLAAFLSSIDRLMRPDVPGPHPDPRVAPVPASPPAPPGNLPLGSPSAARGPSVVYVSPLKALVYDIERNLRAPLAGVARAAESLGQAVRVPRVDIRTGDTPAAERARQLKEPGEILVTTPESLYLLLGSRFAERFRAVHTVIVDEVHALAPTKRGAHLALSLERLAALAERDPQRIGLSATVRPLEEAALYLGGDRPVEIVDAAAPPRLDLKVCVPVPDMERPPEPPAVGPSLRMAQASLGSGLAGADGARAPAGLATGAPEPPGGSILGALYSRAVSRPPAEKGMWAAIYPAVLDAILAHRSTICFVNSRGLAERLCQRLNEAWRAASGEGRGETDAGADGEPDRFGAAEREQDQGPPLVRAHHGSVSHAQRQEIEEGLKLGGLRAIVATSSLEMGIDMGAVDQVLLVESPGSVARGLQRVGRAGHGVGETSSGRIFPKLRGDLLECAVIAERMLAGELEPLRMPRNALDVLAQQVAAHCSVSPGGRTVEELLALASRAGPYRQLSRAALEAVLDMLSGRYPSSDFAELKPLLAWDRATETLTARRGAAMVARLNAGTIPDRGSYGVYLAAAGGRTGRGPDMAPGERPGRPAAQGPRIGELDEEMVFETKAGDCILLGASTWRVEAIDRDRVLVSPAPGEPGRLPFWKGDGPGRPVELGRAVGAFCREVAALDPKDAADRIRARMPLDDLAAKNLAAYIADQRAATGQVPSDRTIVIERFRDELGDWRVCILTPFGAPIHAPWAMALQWQLGRREGFEVQVMYTDDGIVLRLADGEELPALDELLPDPDDLEDRITEQLADTALFAGLFRENAARALLTPRRSPTGRQPLWAQRLRAQSLLATVRRYPAFPIVIETYRQALGDIFDLPGLKSILSAVRARSIRVHEVTTRSASPFARSLVFAYVAAYLYAQDAPLPERRAQALTLDRGLLAELLGEAELRELIDPRVLDELEADLQHLAPGRRARDADELHDLLRRLGDLTQAEAALRCEPPDPPERSRDAGATGSAEGCEAHGPRADARPSAREPDDAPVGDLATMSEPDVRSVSPAPAWLADLARQRRAVALPIAGETRWIAAEDAGLYRDALGCVPPPGLPDRWLAPVESPLEQLVRRWARTHGPFPTREPAARLGLAPAQVEPVLRLLDSRGELVRGEIRPAGSGPEWCDAEVLSRLRRRTLARARDGVAPVDGATLARFLPAWHGIAPGLGADAAAPAGAGGRGGAQLAERIEEAIGQLAGLPLPWSALDRVLLPARVPGYRSQDLDLLAATGQVVWIGRGALGPKDGRVVLYLRGARDALDPTGPPAEERGPRGSDPIAAGETGAEGEAELAPVQTVLLERLGRGACFFMDLMQALERSGVRTGRGELEAALWDLVWAGRVTNDTFAPLRALGGGSRTGRRGREPALAGGRWSLVADLDRSDPSEPPAAAATRRLLARARLLLERYGVVSRETVQAESLPGGFGPLYQVLKQMEASGQVRRGWFVEGLSGAQFALAGALERLRAARREEPPVDGFAQTDVHTLAALDPANPYGALLPWPATGGGSPPRRTAGAWVVLVDGRPVLYVAAGGRALHSFPAAAGADNALELALAALRGLRSGGRRALAIRQVDGAPALESPLRGALLAAGFAPDYDALVPVPAGLGGSRIGRA